MLKRLNRVGFVSLAIAVLLGVMVSSTVAAAPARAKISAHLTKTSFKSAQAGSVKLKYSFSAKSKSFAYLLNIKNGAKWQTVKSVKQKGSFKGSKTMTVSTLFAGKTVKVGNYKLKLSADGGSKTLYFNVIKAADDNDNTCTTDSCLYSQG